MVTKQYSVLNISCQNCVKHIMNALSPIPGVDDIEVDIATKLVSVSGNFDDALIRRALHDAGYPVAS